MINALHLLWICPACAAGGFALAALCRSAKEADRWKN